MDRSADLQEQLVAAVTSKTPLNVTGGNSKAFYGRRPSGDVLDAKDNTGIIDYQPGELTLTARGGTPLTEIHAALEENGQMLPFEPPAYTAHATLAGAIACGLAGPRRPWTGAVRDYLLGVRILTGTGKDLRIGSPVMKNVAGYDLFRPMAGAMGTLGVLLEIILKVLPAPLAEQTLAIRCSRTEAAGWLTDWQRASLPLSAACHVADTLTIRLSGPEPAIVAGRNRLGREYQHVENDFWHQLNEQRLPFFAHHAPLYRINVPAMACLPEQAGQWLVEQAGQQRWLFSDLPLEEVQAMAAAVGGHACVFRNGDRDADVFHPLPDALMTLHRRIRQVLDPHRILNPGRLYREL
jgi:glycolate oxidase FAD binding subunit